MAQVRLFTENATQGLKTYSTVPFDLTSALANERATIGTNQMNETETDYKMFYIDVTAEGLQEDLEGRPPTPDSSPFTIPDYSVTAFDPAEEIVFVPAWRGDILPVPPLPSDYFTHYNDKYYFYSGEVSNLYPNWTNATDDGSIYTQEMIFTTSTPFAWTFWTGNGNYFGISHFWYIEHIYGVGDYTGEVIRFFGNRRGDSSMLIRKNGMSGTALINDWSSNAQLSYSKTSAGTMPVREGAFWIDCSYNGEPYIGILAIEYGNDLTPIRAKGFIISVEFFDFDPSDFYNPPTSDPDIGVGAHNLPQRTIQQTPERMIPRGMFETGITGSGAAPGSIGLKLVRMPLATLNGYMGTYMNAHSTVFSDASQVLQNINNSIVDVFALPISVAMSGSISQFEICGETMNGGAVDYNATQQQIEDCGAVILPEEEGNYLDYEPYTKAVIYIPYCGQYEIPISSFMGGSLQLIYSIDIVTGDCVAYVFATNRFGDYLLVGAFPGNMRLPIPCTASAGNLGIIGSALQKSVGLMAGTAVGAAKMAQGFNAVNAGDYTSQSTYTYGNQTYQAAPTVNTGAMAAAVATQMVAPAAGVGLAGAAGVLGAMNMAGDINAAPVALSSVIGSFGGSVSFNMPQIPYVKIIKAICKTPETYKDDVGITSNISVQISRIQGNSFTIMKNLKINGFNANDKEKQAIYQALTSGFIT